MNDSFDKEHDQVILKSPFANMSFDIDVEFDVHLERLSLKTLDCGRKVMESNQVTTDECELPGGRQEGRGGMGGEELPYDEATSTELLISKWNACPEPGRIYFYHRWDDKAMEGVPGANDGNQGAVVRVHLHRVKCKARTLVGAMQEMRRMALPRNFRRIYFSGKHSGKKETIENA